MLDKPPVLLRRALWLDAVGSGGLALPLVVASGPLAPVLSLPAELLQGVGVFLVLWVGAVLLIVTREPIPRLPVVAVVAFNAVWVVASFGALAGGSVSPNALGLVFVAGQALAVAGFAALQVLGLRAAAKG